MSKQRSDLSYTFAPFTFNDTLWITDQAVLGGTMNESTPTGISEVVG